MIPKIRAKGEAAIKKIETKTKASGEKLIKDFPVPLDTLPGAKPDADE